MENLYKNSSWNAISVIVPALIAIPSLGVLARGLGPDFFGLYSLIFIVLGYSGIFDAGVTKSVVYFVSSSKNCDKEINNLVSTACLLLFTLSFMVVLPVAYFVDDLILLLTSDSSKAYKEITLGIRLALLSIPLIMVNLVFQGYFEGRSKFYELSRIKIAVNPLSSLLPALSTMIIGTLKAAILSLIIAKVLSLIAVFLFYVRDLNQRGQSFGSVSLSSLRKLITFGGWISLSNILSPIMNTCDRFMVASINGSANLSLYSIAADAISKFTIFPVAVSKVIFPIFSDSSKKSIHRDVKRKSFQMIGYPMMVLTVFGIIFSENIIMIWFGNEYLGSTVVVFQLLLIGLFFNSIAQIPYSEIQARGYANYTALLHSLEIIPHIFCLWFLVTNYEIVGAALAITIRSVADALLLILIEKKINAKSRI